MNTEEALQDFRLRIEHYQEKYEPLDEEAENSLSYMKIYNTGRLTSFSCRLEKIKIL
jgi:6-phosphofructo-2-kinase / fructose-2,6-biphosphatase 2